MRCTSSDPFADAVSNRSSVGLGRRSATPERSRPSNTLAPIVVPPNWRYLEYGQIPLHTETQARLKTARRADVAKVRDDRYWVVVRRLGSRKTSSHPEVENRLWEI